MTEIATPPTLCEIEGLEIAFRLSGGLISPLRQIRAVDGVSLDVRRGEVLAIVGESGCGKTTLARALLGLNAPTAGSVTFEGRALSSMPRRDVARLVQPVFQDPYSSLNPRKTVASIIALPLVVQGIAGANERARLVDEMMALVGLPRRLANAYPSQLSGGQRQRVAIARALVLRPRLVVCDEPTSALDVSVRAQILTLLQDLRRELDLTYVLISHDLAVVQHIASRVAVMYLGRVVEIGEAEAVLGAPRHPYTQLLLGSVMLPDPDHVPPDPGLDGEMPDPTRPPPGCRFHPRCRHAMAACSVEVPVLDGVGEHRAACHLLAVTSTGFTEAQR